jgi:hypothetical protein
MCTGMVYSQGPPNKRVKLPAGAAIGSGDALRGARRPPQLTRSVMQDCCCFGGAP